jgi:hypothetical protein
MVQVKRKGQGEFLVSIEEGGSRTEHIVRIDESYYQYLTNNQMSREELIEASFAFLLRKEPPESILPAFDLRVISRYFPDYEEEIRNLRSEAEN